MKLLQYLCIPFLLVLTGCAGCGDDDPLSISKTGYTGNQLKIDGYYYGGYPANENLKQDAVIDTWFLYRNGVALDGNTIEYQELAAQENDWKTSEWHSNIKDLKYHWGVFTIEGNTIQIEKWYPSEKPYSSYVNKGLILNDTTFLITEQYRMVDGSQTDKVIRNETFYFKQFSPKPDSTNPYVVRF